jgi:two-component system nitrate/nitrite response regulator NarL
LINGESNKTIARKIEIAEATVKVHVRTILRKIRVHNRTQAAVWALNNDQLTRSSEVGVSMDEKRVTRSSGSLQEIASALTHSEGTGTRLSFSRMD